MPPTIRIKIRRDEFSVPQNRGHCPIANALKLADDDILAPRVSRQEIIFSRRSSGMRYTYFTPAKAKKFIQELDAWFGDATLPLPDDFWLVLDDTDLISQKSRLHRDPRQAVRQWQKEGTTNATISTAASASSKKLRKKPESPNVRSNAA